MNPDIPQSDAYTELAELAGRLIHEIKNHLGTLSLNLQLLGEDFQEPQTQKERRALQRIEKLQRECGRLTDLSNDFLRFARVGELNLTPSSLKEVVGEVVDFFAPSAEQANIAIKSFLPADLPCVSLDRDLFKQALLNLILNAQQAMPKGGELTIQGEARDDYVCLNFIDTGIGMTPEVMAKIFKPFFSTRSGGSGLGLPTTRKIIEAHQGSIEVESAPQHGTKFTVRLPVAPG
jgi:signal transduction histidine kinase